MVSVEQDLCLLRFAQGRVALSQRQFRCSECGFEAERDNNAALKLDALAASSAMSAGGEARSGAVRQPPRETGLGRRNRAAKLSFAQLS
jgi:transposase